MYMFRSLTLLAASVSAFVAPTSHTFHRQTSVATMGIVPSSFASSSSTTTRKMSSSGIVTAADFVNREIDQNKIIIFSKSYCPYCTKAKELFSTLNVPGTKVYELDNMDNGADIQKALLDITGQRTVPNIFINKKHLGGNDDAQAAYRSGKLQQMIDNTE